MKKSRDGDGVKKVDVQLVDLGLKIYKPRLRPGEGKTLNVLKGVSTTFRAGELNVIPGPSRSGKSSLLNAMARRLRSSLLTRYRTSGTMTFNRVRPTDKEVRSLCSYVTQDDSALLPYLTARETLRLTACASGYACSTTGVQAQHAILLHFRSEICPRKYISST